MLEAVFCRSVQQSAVLCWRSLQSSAVPGAGAAQLTASSAAPRRGGRADRRGSRHSRVEFRHSAVQTHRAAGAEIRDRLELFTCGDRNWSFVLTIWSPDQRQSDSRKMKHVISLFIFLLVDFHFVTSDGGKIEELDINHLKNNFWRNVIHIAQFYHKDKNQKY